MPTYTSLLSGIGVADIAFYQLGFKQILAVESMTPRALARFQDIPDSFQLTGNRKLDCLGIGNGVPVNLAKAVILSTL